MDHRNDCVRRALLSCCGVFIAMSCMMNDAEAESIELMTMSDTVVAGDSFDVWVLLRNNTTNLVGYSVDVDVDAELGATGDVSGDASSSTFFPPRNLIEADPDDSLSEILSFILDQGDGSVFFNAMSDSGGPVDLAIDGFSDVLGVASFTTTPDAAGQYTFSLGPSTALFDGANPVAFDSESITIDVVIPEPSVMSMILVGMVVIARGRLRGKQTIDNV